MFKKIEIISKLVLGISPKPFFRKERFPCPFYGFFSRGDRLFQKSKECAFKGSGRGCRMENHFSGPDFRKCGHGDMNRERNDEVYEIIKKRRVYAEEFCTGPEWKGIPMTVWEKHVMDSKTPRPIIRPDDETEKQSIIDWK